MNLQNLEAEYDELVDDCAALRSIAESAHAEALVFPIVSALLAAPLLAIVLITVAAH